MVPQLEHTRCWWGAVGVRVVALGAAVGGDLHDLAEHHQLAQGVVDGRPGDLGQPFGRADVHFVGRQMDVVAVEDLRDDAPL